MPEAPELEVIKDFLNEEVAGRAVVRAEEPRSLVRSLAAERFAEDVVGRTFGTVTRRGKMLTIPLEPDRLLVVHPMLTGLLVYCPPQTRLTKRTFFVLGMEEMDLRYVDARQMGIVYYVRPDQLAQVPRLEEQGPDALSEPLAFEEFVARLKPFHGEIKGILTRGQFAGGIGNAYADEVLWAAEVSPFKRRKELSEAQLHALHEAIPRVLTEAVAMLRERVGPNLEEQKVRDSLKVHRRGGQSCPRCGHTISELTANQRITSFCRRCQPGSLIKN